MSRKKQSALTPLCPNCKQPFSALSEEDRKVYRLADKFVWFCASCSIASSGTECETAIEHVFDPTIKHVFDPTCECADCVSKRGKQMVYLYSPDLTGAVFQSESPDEERHKVQGYKIGRDQGYKIGRDKGQKDLLELAGAIHEAYRDTGRADALVKQSPPTEEETDFAVLLRFARDKLTGKERAVIEAVCNAGGILPISDLAIKSGVNWKFDANKKFEDVQRRLNQKIKKIGWRLSRRGNAANLNAIPAKDPLKNG
jgi:hypothetical protein